MAWQTKKHSEDQLVALQQEVKQLESVTLVAIEDFENRLRGLTDIPVIQESDWSSPLDTLDIYTMEQLPALSKSIRQITDLEK